MVGFYSLGLSYALSQYNKVSKQYDEQVAVLASGERKVSPADITKVANYENQIRSAGAVKSNMSDVYNMMDIADVGLESIQNSLTNIRGYFLDGTTGSPTEAEVDSAQLSINAEVGSIDLISRTSEYNGRTILYGTSDFYVQSGINDAQGYNVLTEAKTGTDQRGIEIRVSENTGGDDSGTIVEDLPGGNGFAIDEISVDSNNIDSYDGNSYNETSDATDRIDKMSSNLLRMRAMVNGEKNKAETIFNYMSDYQSILGDALDRIKGINFEEEMSKLEDLKIRKEDLSTLISNVNQSNASILNLLPSYNSSGSSFFNSNR